MLTLPRITVTGYTTQAQVDTPARARVCPLEPPKYLTNLHGILHEVYTTCKDTKLARSFGASSFWSV